MIEENFLVKALNNIKSINIETVYNNFSIHVRDSIKDLKVKIDKLYNLIDKIFENRNIINKLIEDQFIVQINKLYIIINDISNISQNNTFPDNDKISRIQHYFNSQNNAPYHNISIFDYHYDILIQLSSSAGVLNDEVDLKRQLEETKKANDQIQQILSNSQIASAALGTSIHSKDFNETADVYKKQSKKWLIATIIQAGIFEILLIIFFIYYSCSGNKELNPNIISLKIAFFTALLTSTVWSGNKYKILCHLCVVYLHKAISLQTFQTFVGATDDKEIKNAVLLECVKSIFVTPETGYIKSEEKNSGTNIIEVMKNFKSG